MPNLSLNGNDVEFAEGETILDIARRLRVDMRRGRRLKGAAGFVWWNAPAIRDRWQLAIRRRFRGWRSPPTPIRFVN